MLSTPPEKKTLHINLPTDNRFSLEEYSKTLATLVRSFRTQFAFAHKLKLTAFLRSIYFRLKIACKVTFVYYMVYFVGVVLSGKNAKLKIII